MREITERFRALGRAADEQTPVLVFDVTSRACTSMTYGWRMELVNMNIDLTDPSALTTQAVRGLLASKDDSAHRQLRISNEGVAYLSDASENLNGVAHQFQTWAAGNDYVGTKAANDDAWVGKIERALRKYPSLPKFVDEY